MRLKELLPLIDDYSEISMAEDGEVIDWYQTKYDINEMYYNKIIVNVCAYGSIMEIEVK